VQQK